MALPDPTLPPGPEADERYPAYRRIDPAPPPNFHPWFDDAPQVAPHLRPAYVPSPEAPRRRVRWGRWFVRGVAALIVLFVIAVGWLAINAPLSRSLQPPTPPSVTLLDDGGEPIARRGAVIGAPVKVADLPPHVPEAFIAIEDRRFYHHWGVDPRGILRALFHDVAHRGAREGGSTITQQLAKNAFLDGDKTARRKLQEVLIAFWLEAWLSKDEILSRYLSNVYFGDNVYGLTAAARHYFGRTPAQLSVGQAAMLAGLVKAPSRLAPTGNLPGAQAREMVVVQAMREAGYLTPAQAADVQPQRVKHQDVGQLPTGTYFADWVLPAARDQSGEIKAEQTVQTTLDRRMQRAAERAVRHAGLRRAQVALVAMRPDGRVVAMVGGRDYAASPFNRATQARRQPGSTFKLFVYLAAMRAGMTPDSTVEDAPVTIGDWRPHNADGKYRGTITLRQAFAVSSNVAAARLTEKVGARAVIKAARDLGISTPIPDEDSIGLGTSAVSLLELTGAYAGVAGGSYPVSARGLPTATESSGWYHAFAQHLATLEPRIRSEMLDLLSASVNTGTGREAALSIDAYGKTGTTQDNRDALFLGFANGLVCGVWVGDDDNKPNPGLSGGGIPAKVWRDFMTAALGVAPKARPVPQPIEQIDPDALPDGTIPDLPSLPPGLVNGDVSAFGLNLHVGRDGSISVHRKGDDAPAPPPRRDPARRVDEDGE